MASEMTAYLDLKLNDKTVGPAIDKSAKDIESKLKNVESKTGKSLSASMGGLVSGLEKAGKVLARGVEKALKAGLAFGAASIAAFLASGSAEAERMQNKLGKIREAMAGLGERFLNMDFGGKDMYEWADILADKIANLDLTMLQKAIDMAINAGKTIASIPSGINDVLTGEYGKRTMVGNLNEKMFKNGKVTGWDIAGVMGKQALGLSPLVSIWRMFASSGTKSYTKDNPLFNKLAKSQSEAEGMFNPDKSPEEIARKQKAEADRRMRAEKELQDKTLWQSYYDAKEQHKALQQRMTEQSAAYVNGTPAEEQLKNVPALKSLNIVIQNAIEKMLKDASNPHTAKKIDELTGLSNGLNSQINSVFKSKYGKDEELRSQTDRMSDYDKQKQEVTDDFNDSQKGRFGQIDTGMSLDQLPDALAQGLNQGQQDQVNREKELLDYNKRMAEIAEQQAKEETEFKRKQEAQFLTVAEMARLIKQNFSAVPAY